MNTYSLGWNDKYQLNVTQKRLTYSIRLDNEESIIITCDLDEKRMEVKKLKNGKETDYLSNYSSLIEGDKLDLNDNGERWEGSSLEGKPFGYGCYYNEKNQLIYIGFMFEGNRVCYGEEIYVDNNTVEYVGHYMNGLRHGWGSLYDMRGNSLYEGNWLLGNNTNPVMMINDGCEDDGVIHNMITELKIGNNCFNQLRKLEIYYFVNLKRLEIGKESFQGVRSFEISDCNELEELVIGDFSFCKDQTKGNDGRLIIHYCSKLKTIDIHMGCFGDYRECFKLFSISERMINRIDLPALNSLTIGFDNDNDNDDDVIEHNCFMWLKSFELKSIIYNIKENLSSSINCI